MFPHHGLMNKRKIIQRICSMLLTALLVFVLGVGSYSPASADRPRQEIPTVDPVLLSQSERSDSLDYLIYFEEQADLSGAYALPWEQRGWYVVDTLTAQAEKSQARVRQFLESSGVNHRSYWIQNMILVESSTRATLNGLLNFTEIQTLQAIPQVTLMTNDYVIDADEGVEIQSTQSNLSRINADDVWAMGIKGNGLVVATIDTGVRFTHEALVSQYRGNKGGGVFDHNYQWWDAVQGIPSPYDDNGHGSHVTGIMVGDKSPSIQIGVAPGAQWIACKAFTSSGSSSGYSVFECGEFLLAPWNLEKNNADASLRPHVINNSWGTCDKTYINWYEGVIDAWQAAGIYPIFSNGNASNCGYSTPPGLHTVGNPSRSYHVTGVGSTGRDNGQYANHSNWGPTDSLDTINPNGYPNLKPQVVAPGASIYSALGNSNTSYGYKTGTSMAAPHVSGLISLIWQAGPCLLGNYAQTETLIQNTAVPIPYATGNGDEGPGNIPNHATGWGEIDALAAVEVAASTCASPNIIGKVFDGFTKLPITNAGVTSQATGNSANDRTAFTYRSGFYIQEVVPGETYTITASAAGYLESDPVNTVQISSGSTVITETFYLYQKDMVFKFLPLLLR